MSLKEKINQDIKEALKEKNELKLSSLRMVNAAITNKEIELRKKDVGLSDQEIIEVISSEVKKRKDSIEGYEKGGRTDLADKEKKEIEILSVYLPEEMSDDEVKRIIKDGIRESGATSQQDFGKVMKVIMPILKGRASGDRISGLVKEALS